MVFGLGGIGLNVIQGARMVGADRIIGIDLNPAREAVARKFGMTHFINPQGVENRVDSIVQLTGGGDTRGGGTAIPGVGLSRLLAKNRH